MINYLTVVEITFDMGSEELPEWTTEMDREILKVLCSELVLTPAIIAENIDRSREAVSRRLNTLEAGELVKKVERGKYQITNDAFMIVAEPVELPDEDLQTTIAEEQAREKAIEENLGITVDKYQEEVEKEYRRLREEKEGKKSPDEILREAFRSVEEQYK